MQLNKGAEMLLPVEVGGGLRYLSNYNTTGAPTDGHVGCTWRGVCSSTSYGNSNGITAKLIQRVTAATPCQVGSTAHGYTTGQSVQIGGAAGIPSINGAFTVTSTGANSSITPADSKVILNYLLPVEGQTAATIVISAVPTLSTPVLSTSDGLSAATDYYYRISSTPGWSHTGRFRTTATLSGSGQIEIVKGNGGTISYGTTAAVNTGTCASPCKLTLAKGIWYHNATGSPMAVVIR